MVDSINSTTGSGTTNRANRGSVSAKEASDTAVAGAAAREASASVEVRLSEEIRSSENASFDEAKVREMRQAFESGTFPLDSRRIAENFAELERLI